MPIVNNFNVDHDLSTVTDLTTTPPPSRVTTPTNEVTDFTFHLPMPFRVLDFTQPLSQTTEYHRSNGSNVSSVDFIHNPGADPGAVVEDGVDSSQSGVWAHFYHVGALTFCLVHLISFYLPIRNLVKIR